MTNISEAQTEEHLSKTRESFYPFWLTASTIIVALPIKNVTKPKTVVMSAIFKPDAIIGCETPPVPSIASKAVMRPMVEPKNPHTIANKLMCPISLDVFEFSCLPVNASIKSTRITSIKRTNGIIKTGPPSEIMLEK